MSKGKAYHAAWRTARRGTPEGAVAFAVRRAKQRAKKKGMDCDVTSEWALEHLDEIDHKCEMTGMPFEYADNTPWQLSFDRVENELGYTTDNIRFVVLMYNYCRNNATDNQVLDFARQMTSFYATI